MSDKLNEQVSALMDDECPDRELKLAVRQLTRDATLMAHWEHYHLISDVLKGDAPAALNVDFAARMRAVIEAEQPLSATAESPSPARTWTKPLAGFALAASVAAVAVFVLRPEANQPVADPLLVQEQAPVEQVVATDSDDDITARMNAYMINHNSLASMNSVYGVLPYVRMASDGR